jgi:Ca2+-binding EF-hand superfamily protein
MTTYRWTTGAAALALLFSSGSFANEPVDTAQRLLQRMDRDIDGKISFEEYRNAMVRRFDDSDRNGDGSLDDDEFPKEWLAGAALESAAGKVSWADFGMSLHGVFDRFDGDKDGQLNAGEIDALAAARKSQEESKS